MKNLKKLLLVGGFASFIYALTFHTAHACLRVTYLGGLNYGQYFDFLKILTAFVVIELFLIIYSRVKKWSFKKTIIPIISLVLLLCISYAALIYQSQSERGVGSKSQKTLDGVEVGLTNC